MITSRTATVSVLRPIRVPPGVMVDGVISDKPIWLLNGEHTVPQSLVASNEWETNGYVETLLVDGVLEVWAACCCSHS